MIEDPLCAPPEFSVSGAVPEILHGTPPVTGAVPVHWDETLLATQRVPTARLMSSRTRAVSESLKPAASGSTRKP